MVSSAEIRTTFLDYFIKNDHKLVESAPLVPRNDPTLMFVNSGMVQFKNIFTGKDKSPYDKAVTAQKAVRAGGKHNDLENVGHTARHHTFFEMLGNFSFGDYFKEQAIYYAWDLVTKHYNLPKEKLIVTCYHEDEEAKQYWKKIAGLSDDRIISISTSDNFWQMGASGPCGPCSEIFYDHGEHVKGGLPGTPEEDGDRFIEIWNLVFMQFEQSEDGSKIALPKKSIDTGMGLERVAAIMQGVLDNYETDQFQTIMTAISQVTGLKQDNNTSFKVIADHMRACSFLIADGVMPSNDGRGYVLRRIMRRAIRHAHMLGYKENLMHQLTPALLEVMGPAYPELLRASALISETLRGEEDRFRSTLDKGLKMLDQAIEKCADNSLLPGDIAFKLSDTYGFPLDLTEDILSAKNIAVDKEKYEQCLLEQKQRARSSWAGSGGSAVNDLWFEIKEKTGKSEFLGYSTSSCAATLQAIITDNTSVTEIDAQKPSELVFNQSPFYGESGGQIGDTGIITNADTVFNVSDTQLLADGLIVHKGKLAKGKLKVGEAYDLSIDDTRRQSIRRNHSVTHLAHAALRNVLGEHVTQKGSMVGPDYMRFDFSHHKAMTLEEKEQVELVVNKEILANTKVSTKLMQPEQAIKAGAMALFGEKYGEEVRVLSMGSTIENSSHKFSTELCGGTHVERTGDIGLFVIIAEAAVGAGVRRITCQTGVSLLKTMKQQMLLQENMAQILKTPQDGMIDKLQQLQKERKTLENQINSLQKSMALQGSSSGATNNEWQKIGSIELYGRVVSDVNPKEIKSLAEQALKGHDTGIVIIVSKYNDKSSVVVAVASEAQKSHDARQLVAIASNELGGKGGGGRIDMAQAGGPNVENSENVLKAIESHLQVCA